MLSRPSIELSRNPSLKLTCFQGVFQFFVKMFSIICAFFVRFGCEFSSLGCSFVFICLVVMCLMRVRMRGTSVQLRKDFNDEWKHVF